jgi:hypothetical protein
VIAVVVSLALAAQILTVGSPQVAAGVAQAIARLCKCRLFILPGQAACRYS